MSTKRILAIIPNSEIGGAERATLDWIRWRGPDFEYVALVAGEGGVAAELRSMGITVHLLPRWRQRNFWRHIWTVCSIVRGERIDLIHSCMQPAHLLGGAARLITGCPEVHFNHGPIGTQWIQGLSPWLPTDCLMVASAYMMREQQKFCFIAHSLERVPIGLNVEALAPDSAARAGLRASLGLEAEELVIAMFGRIVPWKGQHLFLEVLEQIFSKEPNLRWRALVIGGSFPHGDAKYEGELQRSVEAGILRDRVIFTGHVHPAAPYYDVADVIVHASTIAEPFGLVVAEAMLKEKLVVAADLGGPAEMIDPLRTGYLFETNDPVALAIAIRLAIEQALLPDQSKGSAATKSSRIDRKCARMEVAAVHDIRHSTSVLEQIYCKVLNQSASCYRLENWGYRTQNQNLITL